MNPDGSSNTNPLQTYTVIPGDNLYDIARSKGITLQEIEAANPQIANFDIIHPGDIVNIPTAGAVDTSTGASGAGATGSYTVAAGDNLSEIAQAHGMSLQEIESSNPQIQNFDLIHPGEVINLPGSSASPAPTTDTSGVNGGTSSTDSSTTSPITSTPSTDPNQQTDPTTNGSTDTTTTPDPTQTTTPPVSGSTDPGSSGTDTTSPSPSDSTTPTTTTNPGDQGSVGSPGVGVEGANDPSFNSGQVSQQGSLYQSESGGGFPNSSSYPVPPDTGEQIAEAASSLNAGTESQGWASSGSPAPADIAKSVFEVEPQPKTDPLNINDKNQPSQ